MMGLQSPAERAAIFDRTLARLQVQGWRVEARDEFEARIVKGQRLNHLLHLLLSILTLGVWAIVWALLAIFWGEQRYLIHVNKHGRILDRFDRPFNIE
jgi:hypothetical protein